MTREKFPEKIPFRLTRMLTNAMEVTGIDGNYRLTCESVMQVLRENKDSVMAVLEAFVYDPLLNWRLMDSKYHRFTYICQSPRLIKACKFCNKVTTCSRLKGCQNGFLEQK